jgi:hypothetical protein
MSDIDTIWERLNVSSKIGVRPWGISFPTSLAKILQIILKID